MKRDVLLEHLDHDLDHRPDGTIRCRTCSYTLLPSKRATPIYAVAPGCAACRDGFKGENEHGQLVACLTCRPHLIPLFTRREAIAQQRARALAEREVSA